MSTEKGSQAAIDITTKNGLLYRNGKVIPLPEADKVADEYGYMYAERLVEALENGEQITLKERV